VDDDELFEMIFESEGAIPMTWEIASRCSTPREDASPCFDADTKQPNWNCTNCGGLGAEYSAPVEILALFRGQSKWKRGSASGSTNIGEAQLTTPLDVKPGYTDDRIRDRFTCTVDVEDYAKGVVFYPAAVPIPFNFDGSQRAWRVQLQSLEQSARTRPQP
jgi:hypothetical protein